MADRLEVSKTTEYVALGPPADTLAVSKLVMFVLLVPGDDGGEETARQGHCYNQIVRNS